MVRRSLSLLGILLSLSCGNAGQAPQVTVGDAAQAEAASKRLMKALDDRDLAEVGRLLARDFRWTLPDGTLNRTQTIKLRKLQFAVSDNTRSFAMRTKTIDVLKTKPVQVRIVVAGDVTLHSDEPGIKIRDIHQEIESEFIWIKNASGWQLWRERPLMFRINGRDMMKSLAAQTAKAAKRN